MKKCFALALLLSFTAIFSACQKTESIIVTREIITNATLEITATPKPTEEPTPLTPLGGGGQYIVVIGEKEGNDSEILLINPQDKSRQSLTTIRLYARGYYKWSPDGTKIVFNTINDNGGNLVIIDLATNEMTQLLENPLTITAFDWSPDGSQIAFLGEQSIEGDGTIYKINIDGSSLKEIATQDGLNVAASPYLSWYSEDYLLVTAALPPSESNPFNGELFEVNANDGTLRQISDEHFNYIYARLSPDARHLTFFSNNADRGFDLLLGNGDSNTIERLIELPLTDIVWSPDSRQIAYAYNGSISTMDVQEGTAVAIVNMYDTLTPSWSPDGEWIAFVGKSKETSYFQLYIVRSDGTDLTLLTNAEQHLFLPIWQP